MEKPSSNETKAHRQANSLNKHLNSLCFSRHPGSLAFGAKFQTQRLDAVSRLPPGNAATDPGPATAAIAPYGSPATGDS